MGERKNAPVKTRVLSVTRPLRRLLQQFMESHGGDPIKKRLG
jgi:hypothetical protein